MTQSEFQALERLLDRLTLQVDDMSAKVGELTTGQQLIEQRLLADKTSAARETQLIEALSKKEIEMNERLATAKAEVKESHFTFHLRVLTSLVLLLALASFPQLVVLWKAVKVP